MKAIESVAMESTGVYWIPLYELLESRGLEVVLVNAKPVACRVPGRKTDMIGCQWIQLLHSCGLLRGSVPTRPKRSVRFVRCSAKWLIWWKNVRKMRCSGCRRHSTR